MHFCSALLTIWVMTSLSLAKSEYNYESKCGNGSDNTSKCRNGGVLIDFESAATSCKGGKSDGDNSDIPESYGKKEVGVSFWVVDKNYNQIRIGKEYMRPVLEKVGDKDSINGFYGSAVNDGDNVKNSDSSKIGKYYLRIENRQDLDYIPNLAVIYDDEGTRSASGDLLDIDGNGIASGSNARAEQWKINVLDKYMKTLATIYSPRGDWEIKAHVHNSETDSLKQPLRTQWLSGAVRTSYDSTTWKWSFNADRISSWPKCGNEKCYAKYIVFEYVGLFPADFNNREQIALDNFDAFDCADVSKSVTYEKPTPEWGEWGEPECSVSGRCGQNGALSRTRVDTTGVHSAEREVSDGCSTKKCEVCGYEEWSTWTECTYASCESLGVQTRKRSSLAATDSCNAEAKEETQSQTCGQQRCCHRPIDFENADGDNELVDIDYHPEITFKVINNKCSPKTYTAEECDLYHSSGKVMKPILEMRGRDSNTGFVGSASGNHDTVMSYSAQIGNFFMRTYNLGDSWFNRQIAQVPTLFITYKSYTLAASGQIYDIDGSTANINDKNGRMEQWRVTAWGSQGQILKEMDSPMGTTNQLLPYHPTEKDSIGNPARVKWNSQYKRWDAGYDSTNWFWGFNAASEPTWPKCGSALCAIKDITISYIGQYPNGRPTAVGLAFDNFDAYGCQDPEAPPPPPPPVACEYTSWSEWSCDKVVCGLIGSNKRQRSLVSDDDCFAPEDAKLVETGTACETDPCPCKVSEWSSWTCGVVGKCGQTGTMRRSRYFFEDGKCEATDIELEDDDNVACGTELCVCELTEWSAWVCSETDCGTVGVVESERAYIVKKDCRRGDAILDRQGEACEAELCPCTPGSWSEWECSVTGECGQVGVNIRTRALDEDNDASDCEGEGISVTQEGSVCNTTECCVASEWSAWTCSVSQCGSTGIYQSTRTVVEDGKCQILKEKVLTLEREGPKCQTEKCPCELGPWSEWQCNIDLSICGLTGSVTRQRTVEDDENCLPPSSGVTKSLEFKLIQSETQKSCASAECCVLSSWSEWECTVSGKCGQQGTYERERNFVTSDKCIEPVMKVDLLQTDNKMCATDLCECPISPWSAWTCSVIECGSTGVLEATRGYVVNALCQTMNAELHREGKECSTAPCACTPGPWTTWSCTANESVCGSKGESVRTRVFSETNDCVLPEGAKKNEQGKVYGLEVRGACSGPSCCSLTPWSEWSCSVSDTCGLTGQLFHERTHIKTDNCLASELDVLKYTADEPCHTDKCECPTTSWSPWSCSVKACSSKGHQLSSRSYITGKDCQTLDAELIRKGGECETETCTCESSEWSSWVCDANAELCGTSGKEWRQRKYVLDECVLPLTVVVDDDGVELAEGKTCYAKKCCGTSSWSDWSCTVEESDGCGLTGKLARYRTFIQDDTCTIAGAVTDLRNTEGTPCHTEKCECKTTEWSEYRCSEDDCGTVGVMYATRGYIVTADCQPKNAELRRENGQCETEPCLCEPSAWTQWACDSNVDVCGSNGFNWRQRVFDMEANCVLPVNVVINNDGVERKQGSACTSKHCCGTTAWSAWTCSVSNEAGCGLQGKYIRDRTFIETPGCMVTGADTDLVNSNGQVCETDKCECELSPWSEYQCSATTCGSAGTRYSTRGYITKPDCLTKHADLRREDGACATDACVCEPGEWSDWTCNANSDQCGSSGSNVRKRKYDLDNCELPVAAETKDACTMMQGKCTHDCRGKDWRDSSNKPGLPREARAYCNELGMQHCCIPKDVPEYDASTQPPTAPTIVVDEDGIETEIGDKCSALSCCSVTSWTPWTCSVTEEVDGCGMRGEYLRVREFIPGESCTTAGAGKDLQEDKCEECWSAKCECELTSWSEWTCSESACSSVGTLTSTRGYITNGDCQTKNAQLVRESDQCETESCVCEASAWSSWQCTADASQCGSSGVNVRTRSYDIDACVLPDSVVVDKNGIETGTGTDCSAMACCGTTDWSSWTCSVSNEVDGCDQSGKYHRERSFKQTAECTTNGATTDLRNTENTPCSTDKCECNLSEWSDFKCSEDACGSEGVMVATRGYITNPDCQVMKASVRKEDGACKTEPCLCTPSDWSSWVCSAAEATCGSAGQMGRQRKYDTTDCVVPNTVTVDGEGVEKSIGAKCTATPCCVTTPWSDWTCSVSEGCGLTGKLVRDRAFIENEKCSIAGVDTDLHNTEGVACHTEKCECELTNWSEYVCSETACSSEGVLVSTRGYITNADCVAKDAELSREDGVCETEPCLCKPTSWSEWRCSADSAICGSSGTNLRTRSYDIDDCVLQDSVVVDADGVEIGTGAECKAKPCCETTMWSDWTCSASTEVDGCGKQGKLLRDRTFVELDSCTTAGAKTDLRNTENAICYTDKCECEMSEWSAYKCSEDACGSEGVMVATRGYVTKPDCQVMGAEVRREDGTCKTEPCLCNPSDWSSWVCSAGEAICGSVGQEWRERKYDAADCVIPDTVKVDGEGVERNAGAKCTATPCCVTTPWSDWTCSVSEGCGLTGKLVRDRALIENEKCSIAGVDTDLHNTEGVACHTEKCECELTNWSEYVCSETACSSEGVLVSTRGYITNADCVAKDAELSREDGVCETEPCLCKPTSWSEWRCSADSAICGSSGTNLRTRSYDIDDCVLQDSVVVDADGVEIGTGAECKAKPCCETTMWSDWTCSASTEVDGCGKQGKLLRDRTFVELDSCTTAGAKTDLRNTENAICYTDKCECEMSEWSAYKCSEDACGSEGVMVATRGYVTKPDCQVMGAEVRREDGTCKTEPCLCNPSDWSSWVCSAGEAICGSVGQEWRERKYDAADCVIPDTVKVDGEGVERNAGAKCTATPCCVTTPWSDWTCSVSEGCGLTGKLVRDRALIENEKCSIAGVDTDLHNTEGVACHTEKCECELTNWSEYVCSETACSSEGVLVSTRGYITNADCVAKDAELSREDGVCETEPCLCKPTSWSEWRCSADPTICGSPGTSLRTRSYDIDDCVLPDSVVVDAGGVETGTGAECSTTPCCGTSEWSSWMCTVSTEDDGCGQHGKLVRERTFIETLNCITEGADTDLRNTENTPCYTDKCECEMSEWSDYECSETACSSEGVLVSTRGYFTTPDCQVMSSAVRREDGVCKTEPCVCKAGSWSPWVCSADKNYCGSTGTNMRERKYDTSECVLPESISTDEAGVETQKGTPCSGKPCCGTSAWSEWQCSVTLAVDKCNASGKYVRDRAFVKTEECSTAHAQTDLHNTDNVICHTETCECELTEWSEYACSESACSSEGVRFSTRGYITTPTCEPKDAELRREDGKCKTQACVCTPSAWSPWVCDSDADVCGSEGSTWRHRKYKVDDDCVLPEDTEIDNAAVETQEGVKCQSKSCCELSAWSEWECTVTEDEGCGLTGKLVRDRVFLETDECTTSGDPADLHDTDNAACHASLCECELSEWVAQPCSCAECSCVGEMHSTRYYKTHAGCQVMDAELTRLDGPCESEPCYVHPTEWTVWACDAPVVCGAPGHLYRERSYDMEQGVLREGVITDENDIEKNMGGKCHYTPCCETSEWSEWTCTVNNDDHECGVAGKLEQYRTFNQVGNCTIVGDETNLVKTDNEACYTDKCECELSEWSDFRCSETACSSSGMMVSQRYYETGPDCEAKNAELCREAEACETELCACEVSNWTPWMCNADMDQCNAQGVTQRSRTYSMGDDCEVPETVVVDEAGLETQTDAACQSTPCCGVSAWSEWTCTVDNDDGCGLEGHYVRDRKYIRTDGCSIQGDDTDLTNTDNVMCRTDKCECLLSEWSDFACSATACGSTGVLHASRWYITNDDCQTMNADLYTEGDACDTPACECEPSAWTEWSCDADMATCGSVGVLSQYRTFNLTDCVLPEEVHTTEDGREVAQNGVCNGPVCCDTTQWTGWSCSKHTEKDGCNQIGHLVRARSFVEDGECLTAGADLDLRNAASTECATGKCECEMTPWSEYTCNESACSSEGEMVSTRGYILSDNCQPMSSETRRVIGVCETAPCVCEPSAWSEWVCDLGGKTQCSAAGYNRRQRTYDVNSDDCVPPPNVEITDEGVEHSQGDRCINTPCCDVLAWSEWECNVDKADGCGVTGRMARSRTFVENDLCMTEGDETNLYDVSNHVCSTDLCECPLSTWSEWQCGVTTCGSTGTMVSVRGYITSNGMCQTKDAELTRTGEACRTEACPCKADNWSSWTCSADLTKCGQNGKVLRERVFKDISGCILNKEAKVSADATSAGEIEANGTCSSTSCCELTSWSAWTCSTDATCGVVGRLGRTREHIDDGNCSLDGDEAVLVDNSSTTCMEACPECEVTEWSDWTCSVTECGSDGVNHQTRAYIPAEQCQSVGATKLTKTGTKCATDACACEPGLWAEWQCNADTEVCGQTGNMVRERVFTDTSDCQLPEAVVKHKDGTATEAQLADACNGPVCCKLSEWSSWECSVSGECGQVGQEFRERSRINTLTCLPDAADVLRDTDNKACSTDKCECPLSPWSEWQCDVLACGSTGKLRSVRGYVVSAECQTKDTLLTRVGDACSTEPCSCIAQPWTTWSCTADTSVCGSTGVTVRTRDFTFTDGCVVSDDAVTDEAGTHARQTETAEVCSGPKCCDLSEWSAYTCTAAGQECGLEGTLYRERTHVVKNKCLPNPTDALRTTDNEKCYTDKCECPLTPWSEATCSVTKCSTVGVLVSTRGYETSDDCEPKGASMRRETGPCQTALCPCQPSTWSEWTCSADANTCNSVGMQWRQRVYDLDHCDIPSTAVVSAEGVEIDQGGACSAKKCCATTEWAEWTCTVSTATDGCGKTGKEVRERAFIPASDCTTAGAEIELRTTNNVACSSDLCECKLTEWTESQCSETACSSTGVLVATRAYMTGPDCQAMDAELRKEEGTCETEACMCEPAQWSEWLCDSDEHMCGAVGFNWRERAYILDECVLPKNVVTDNGVEKQRGDACSSKKCCATTSWSEWTCSKSNEDGCGLTGKEVRERSFIENDGCTTEGADAQLRNTENVPCYTDKCECELSPWTPYKCSETACSSQGVMLSTRSYITTPECEPKQTALRREDGTCETEMCACTPGEWSAWTCSADEEVCNTIGKNLRHRTYADEECALPADLLLDGARREQQVGTACAATPCCVVSPWSEYECSVSEEEGCGLEGVLVRDRSFVHTDKCSTKGAALPLRDVINTKCYTSLCECTLSEWSAYSCSATACSTDGDMVSTRHYNTNDDCQEMDAELTRTDGPCRTSACICKTSEWSESVCDADESVCGSAGHITKTRTFVLTDDCVLPEGVVVGANGLETKQGQACSSTPCCVTSPWASWECTVTMATDGCGRTGVLVRDRVLLQNAQCSVAGVDVALRNTDNVVCHTDKCECPLTQWTAWTCSETACSSEGALVSTRGYIVNDNCQAMDAETHRTGGACSTDACLCKPSEWSAWACTADEKVCSSAGAMVRERNFAVNDCVVPEDITTDTHGVETQTHTSPCHATPCCEITAWSEWVCTVADAAQCGLTGKYVRNRAFIETDSCSTAGADTELRTTENVACSNAKCECPLTEWTDYKCSETACSSKGDMYSTRAYIADENCQTMSAETYRVDGACETEACLCKPSAWSEWLCDANEEICGSPGHNWRHRAYDVNECVVPDTIVTDDAGVETQMGGLCAATECCQTSPWSDYVCTVDLQTDGCGATGKLVRNREYLKNDKCTTVGADSDLFNTENVACHTDKCECKLTPWTTWSCSETACSTEGVMFSTRGYEVKPSCQTINAETYKTAGVCQTSACVCDSSAWSEWLCDLDSDVCESVGKNWRQRKFDTDRCVLPANIVTDADGFEMQTSGVPCYGKKCCATSTWSEWYCTVETEEMCGLTGKYVRDRAFVEADGCSIVGAEDDLRNTENVPCNNDLCECPLTAWTDFECSESACSSEGVLVATRGYVTRPNCQTKDAETSKTGDVCKTEACVCTPSQWSSWVCDADTERCGSSGYNWRQRAYDLDDCVLPATITTDASGVETQRGEVCHGAECCVTSPWSEFVCTVNIQTDGCGVAGKLQRTRTFIEDGRCSTTGADIELMNTDNMDCATDLCECPLTEWTKLKCSETACGSTGVMYATRGYIAGPTCQVMDAETYRIEGSCMTEACVCSPSGWSAWVCDSNMDVCGSVGHTWRERTFAIEDCVLPANIIADEAGVERQQGDKCGAKPCCETTSWSEYMCTVRDADGCGLNGKLVRTRTFVDNDECTIAGAHVDLRHTDNEPCSTDKCECELTPWTDFKCSETSCSSEGVLFSTRGYMATDECQTKDAATYREDGVCTTEACECKNSMWTEWHCDADDAFCSSVGSTYRQRKFETEDCILPTDIVLDEDGFEVQTGSACTAKKCCDVTQWSDWTCNVGKLDGCSVSGEYVRDRAYIVNDACTTAGDDTDLHNTENVACHTDLCECAMTSWTEWKCSESACSSTGVTYATRGYMTGPHCQSKDAETYRTDGECMTDVCVCAPSEWTQWTCSANEAVCGSAGKNVRQRAYNGEECVLPEDIVVDDDRVEVQIGTSCRATECCGTSEWSEFVCSVNTHMDGCGVEGKLIRERAFIETDTCSTAGAMVDLRNTEDEACHTDKCECPMTPWSDYACSATACSTDGVMYSTRGYISGPNCQAMDAETRREDGPCSTEECVCKPTNWSKWQCDADVNKCGSRGKNKRYRQYVVSECELPADLVVSETGVETQTHEEDCYTPACCDTSAWTNWACSVSEAQGCGLTGEYVRTRAFVEDGKCITSGADTDLFNTNNEACYTNKCECPLTSWSEYVCSETVCSSEGVMTSTRGYVSGLNCRTLGAEMVRTGEVCKTDVCACVPSKWSEKVCNADMDICGSQGNYIQTRKFDTTDCDVPEGIVTDADGTETRVGEACHGPVCCDVSPWSGWTCTVGDADGCGLTGHYIRERAYLTTDDCSTAGAIIVLVSNGDDECSTKLCECEMTQWTEYTCTEEACSSQGEWVATRGYITASDCQTKDAETRRVDGVCQTEVCECEPTHWSEWQCDVDEHQCNAVGNNWRERHFAMSDDCVVPDTVAVDAAGVEKQMSATPCSAKPCCATSTWSDWECSVFTATDGCNREGHYVRERTFVETSKCTTEGSDATLRNTDNEACFTDMCECPLTQWTEWTCSVTACSSEGVQVSTRGYITNADCETRDVELYREQDSCTTPVCACKPSAWSPWACDVDTETCGNTGLNTRHRKFDLEGCQLPAEIVTNEQGIEMQSGATCEGPVCCSTNQWSTWSCSWSTQKNGCGLSGRLERTRDHILVDGCVAEGDDTDLYHTDNEACYTDLCECELSEWSAYECSEEACSSEGVSYSTRAYLVEDDCQTMDAELYREDGKCTTVPCVCEPSSWTSWVCDADEATCGATGSTWRYRTYDLEACEMPEDVVSDEEGIEIQQGSKCHAKECCPVGQWTEWVCSMDTNKDGCGMKGTHIRSRDYITSSTCMVEGDNISLEESDGSCYTELCECELTEWSQPVCDTTACSSEGVMRSTRGYITNEHCQTKDAALHKEMGSCETEACTCEPDTWTEWFCDADMNTCGSNGVTWRTRTFDLTQCDLPASVDADESGVETQTGGLCYGPRCCEITPWSEWTCSITATDGCGQTGHEIRTREHIEDGECMVLEKATLQTSDGESCSNELCECVLQEWSSWVCSESACGTSGIQTRTRAYIADDDCHTNDEAVLTDTSGGVCVNEACACMPSWAEWTEVSSCTTDEVTGTQCMNVADQKPVNAPVSNIVSGEQGAENSEPYCVDMCQRKGIQTCDANGMAPTSFTRADADEASTCAYTNEICECPCEEVPGGNNTPIIAGAAVGAAAVLAAAGAAMWYSRGGSEAVGTMDSADILGQNLQTNPVYEGDLVEMTNDIYADYV